MANLHIFDTGVLFERLARKFADTGKRFIKNTGGFRVALCGGSTPTGLYEVLVSKEFRDSLDWEKVDFFLGDERDVSPESVMSNFHNANEKLFKPLSIERGRLHRWPTEIIDAEEVARRYGQALTRFFGLDKGVFPRFDLVLLGLGDDGHTASLFPNTEGLREKKRIAIANRVDKLDTNRLTLTYPVFNKAANVIFMATGESKSAALREVLEGKQNCRKFPAQCVKPKNGTLNWYVDKAAAGELRRK